MSAVRTTVTTPTPGSPALPADDAHPRSAGPGYPAPPSDVLVVGGGVVGLTAAWRALVAGLSVTVLDPNAGSGATRAAAGMLAPVSEAEFGEDALARLNVASAALWPAFARELGTAAGSDLGYAASGTLSVAYDAADARRGRDLLGLQRRWGLDAEEVTVADARVRLPLLGPHVSAAFWAPGDHQVDPRALTWALRSVLLGPTGAGSRSGTASRGRLVATAAVSLVRDRHGAVVGATDSDGTTHTAGLVVLAAGAASAWVAREVHEVAVPVRGVLGTSLRLDARDAPWFRDLPVLRGTVQQRPVYVVARPSGEVVVGATSDEGRDGTQTRSGDVFALLRDARALVPGLDELPFVEATTRARPATPDHLPLIGRTAVPGLVLATGHHRNGVLQVPATAAVLDAVLAGDPVPVELRVADPARVTDPARAAVPV